jgi:hypothetical protein
MAKYKPPVKTGYKVFVPKGLKGGVRKLYLATAVRPVGEWSRDLLENTEGGKVLQTLHFKYVVQALKKAKPKTKAEVKKVVEKAMKESPAQRLVILYEKSLRVPLDTREFVEYLELFRECFPAAYKSLYGRKSPQQIAAETAKTALKRRV